MYFYTLLKPLANLDTVQESDYMDWGMEDRFRVETAVGECAGVIIDLVSTLLFDSDEKLGWSRQTFEAKQYSDSIYHSYNVFINSAKTMLLGENVKNNSQMSVINDFDRLFVETGIFNFSEGSFKEHVLQINKQEHSEAFASEYLEKAGHFLDNIKTVRETKVAKAG
jgi:sulfite reductase (ferredoxin)